LEEGKVMNKKVLIDDYHGSYVEPFEAVTIKGRAVACRFCEAMAWIRWDKKISSKRYDASGHKIRPDKSEFMMKEGSPAFRLITSTGPTGTAYVCPDCARRIAENLQRELEKSK
jgi:uncharacterized protein YlaI